MGGSLRALFIPFLLFVLLFAHTIFANNATCYTPAGTDRNADFNRTIYQPCSNDTVSMCCATTGTGNDYCNPNGIKGLCYNYVENQYWRESCTDQTWQSPSCIKLFVNNTGYQGQGTPEYNGDGTPIEDVEVTPCSDGSICDGYLNTACCDAGEGVFIDYATGETQAQNPNGTSATTKPAGRSSTGISSPTASGTSPAATSGQTSSPPNKSSPSAGLSGGAIAGIVVGAVLAVLLLLLTGCFFGRRRKTRSVNVPGQDTQYQPEPPKKMGAYKQSYSRSEMESTPYPRSEMESIPYQPRHELPGEHVAT